MCFGVDDIELVFDVVYVVCCKWGKMFVVECVNLLFVVVDWMEKNLKLLVVVEMIDNGKLLCEMMVVDLLFVIDYFCYFVGCICV